MFQKDEQLVCSEKLTINNQQSTNQGNQAYPSELGNSSDSLSNLHIRDNMTNQTIMQVADAMFQEGVAKEAATKVIELLIAREETIKVNNICGNYHRLRKMIANKYNCVEEMYDVVEPSKSRHYNSDLLQHYAEVYLASDENAKFGESKFPHEDNCTCNACLQSK